MADLELIAENIVDHIERVISRQEGGRFVLTQEESVELLRDVVSSLRDRANGIQAEIDGES